MCSEGIKEHGIMICNYLDLKNSTALRYNWKRGIQEEV